MVASAADMVYYKIIKSVTAVTSPSFFATRQSFMHAAEALAPVIFVVDDDDAVRASLRLLLHSFGWQVRTFASADDLLKELPQRKPNCFLIDLNMPGTNGAELHELLSAREPGIPSVFITGRQDSPLARRVQEADAGPLLLKPFQAKELKSSIERVLAG